MNAIQQLLTEHIGIWSAADTEKKSGRGRSSGNAAIVYGVKKLRELILELAVRGKLVPQDAKDEPASELLKKIAAEKAKLVAEGKIKKEKPPPGNTLEVFETPRGWELVNVSTLTLLITDGTHHTPKYQDTGVPFISVKDINGSTVSFKDCKYLSEKEHKEINSRCNPERNDILLCRIGTLGRPTIVDTDQAFSLFVSVGLLKVPKTVKFSRYLHLVLSSQFMYRQYDSIKAGGSHTNKLNLGDIPKLLIPLPPLAEQHRIVAKVDELMALCDQLETQHNNAAEAHEKLVSFLLGTLTQSQDAADFSANWQRIAAHFDTLFTTEASIDVLKQTLLQLAVMGKLVPQDATDEPASELLKKIAAEKAKLIAEGKIKKDKPLPPMADEGKPFELPGCWVWAFLSEIITTMDSGWSPACLANNSPSDAVWGILKTTAVQVMHYSANENKELPEKLVPRPEAEVKAGDILFTRAGPINRVAISCLVQETRPKLMISDKIIRFHPIIVDGKFLTLCLNTGSTAEYLESAKSGMAASQVNISQEKLRLAPIPIPPVNLQRRIVAKVDEVMALCDQLKTHITDANQLQQKLADAMVEAAVA